MQLTFYSPLYLPSPFIDSTQVLPYAFESAGKLIADEEPWDRHDWVSNPVILELARRLDLPKANSGQGDQDQEKK